MQSLEKQSDTRGFMVVLGPSMVPVFGGLQYTYCKQSKQEGLGMRLINIHAHVEGIVSYIIGSAEYLSTRQAIMQHYVCAVMLRHLGCYVGPCACTCSQIAVMWHLNQIQIGGGN